MDWKRLDNPYWFELLSILILAMIGVFLDVSFLPPLAVAFLTAVLLDMAINHFKGRRFSLSKSAAISGILIGSILQPAPLFVFAFAAAVAVLSKHLIRTRKGNVFNPAALGIILGIVLFGAVDGWWSSAQPILVIILGVLVAWKIGKLRLAASFLLSFFILGLLLLSATQGLAIDQAVFSLQNLPFFLGFFMLTEPKTTPFQKQLFFGPVFAVITFALLLGGLPSFLLGGLLIGNVVSALHRKWKSV